MSKHNPVIIIFFRPKRSENPPNRSPPPAKAKEKALPAQAALEDETWNTSSNMGNRGIVKYNEETTINEHQNRIRVVRLLCGAIGLTGLIIS
ncbi:hypothetical protein D3C81_1968140 [compost metagenome]